jgi:GxxExxY protein
MAEGVAPIPDEVNRVSKQIVDAACKVHSAPGPGLLESVHEKCMAYELTKRGLDIKSQVVLPIGYDGVTIDAGLRLDMLVAKCVIGETKAVEQVAPVHKAQLLTYLKLAGHRVGLLINFNVPLIGDGITRIAL